MNFVKGIGNLHCFVVAWFCGVMYKTRSTAVDVTTKEGHTKAPLLRNPLENSDEVRPLKVLHKISRKANHYFPQIYKYTFDS